jgi:hypothetical protein
VLGGLDIWIIGAGDLRFGVKTFVGDRVPDCMRVFVDETSNVQFALSVTSVGIRLEKCKSTYPEMCHGIVVCFLGCANERCVTDIGPLSQSR